MIHQCRALFTTPRDIKFLSRLEGRRAALERKAQKRKAYENAQEAACDNSVRLASPIPSKRPNLDQKVQPKKRGLDVVDCEANKRSRN